MRFGDQVLFCTGAGSGIGAAVARRFAAEGGTVAVVDVNADGVRSTSAQIEGSLALTVDVSDELAVRTAVQGTINQFGRIDAVYNGAAILLPGGVMSSPVADLQRHLTVNTVGTYLVCKEAGRHMKASGRGAIVNTSSVVADVARVNRGFYAASKGAIVPLSRHLALELAPEVRVNCVSPGPTLTGMTREHYLAAADTEDKAMEVVGSQVMLNRVASPEELASAICFLLSEDASYVNATVLTVDGGMTAE